MAITETQFERLKERVAALEKKPDFTHKVRHTPPLLIVGYFVVPTLTILITAFLGVVPSLENYSKLQIEHQVNGSLIQPLQQIEQMGKDIAGINGTLKAWSPLITPQVFNKSLVLPPSQFKKALSELKAVVANARKQDVRVPSQIIRGLQTKLLGTTRSAPDFWPTAAEFVSYRSFNGASPETQQLGSANVPNCADSPPSRMKITAVPDSHTIKMSTGVYENCRITLDSAQDDDRINFIPEQRISIHYVQELSCHLSGRSSKPNSCVEG